MRGPGCYPPPMTRILVLCLCLAALPAHAQVEDDGGRGLQDGIDLLSEGTRLLLEGLMNDLGPAIEGLRERIEDLDAYHPPEILPNGDIIIRRRTPLETTPEPGDGIDL